MITAILVQDVLLVVFGPRQALSAPILASCCSKKGGTGSVTTPYIHRLYL